MKYPRVFRQRYTQEQYDWLRETSLEMGGSRKGWSQQQIGRNALELYRREFVRAQGVAPRIADVTLEPEVKVAKRPAPKKRVEMPNDPMTELRQYLRSKES